MNTKGQFVLTGAWMVQTSQGFLESVLNIKLNMFTLLFNYTHLKVKELESGNLDSSPGFAGNQQF